jgi:hypothetical protein
VTTDPLEAELPPEPARSIIGHITYSLAHLADMVSYVDEYTGDVQHHHLRIACTDSYLLYFRMLYLFLLEDRSSGRKDAHRSDFLDRRTWQPDKKSVGARRMAMLADFTSKHRAHLSMSRFEDTDLQHLLGVRRMTAEYLARILLDYLDVLDSFIARLPDTKESGKRAWIGAAYGPRYKIEVGLGLRQSDYPDKIMPFKSVAIKDGSRDSPAQP